jgi:RNA polymerase sigma-70 factor (ECF subfamily)
LGTPIAGEPIGAVDRALDLEAALGSLTAEQREVVVLHYVADLPLREIAEIIGIREGTVKSRLHAGLATLRAGIERPRR